MITKTEPACKLTQVSVRKNQDESYAYLIWKCGEQEVRVDINEYSSAKDTEIRPNLLMTADPRRSTPLKNIGDEAFLLDEGSYSKGTFNVIFRRGKVRMDVTAASADMAQRFARLKIEAIKFLLLPLLLSLALPLAAKERKDSDRERRGYRGPVKTVSTQSVQYFVSDGKLKRSRLRSDSIERFDTDGRLLEYTAFTNEGSILYGDIYSYNPQGQLIASSTKHSEFVYLSDRKTYTYDDRGNLIVEQGFDLQGNSLNKSMYSYDEKNRRTEWTSFSYHPKQPSKPHRWTYSYSERGQLNEERAFSDEGAGFQPTDSLSDPHRKLFFYDEQNRPRVILYYKTNGDLAKVQVTEYERRGDISGEVKYDRNGVVQSKKRYKYNYDKFGNWTKQVEYIWTEENGKGKYQIEETTYQRIEYLR